MARPLAGQGPCASGGAELHAHHVSDGSTLRGCSGSGTRALQQMPRSTSVALGFRIEGERGTVRYADVVCNVKDYVVVWCETHPSKNDYRYTCQELSISANVLSVPKDAPNNGLIRQKYDVYCSGRWTCGPGESALSDTDRDVLLDTNGDGDTLGEGYQVGGYKVKS